MYLLQSTKYIYIPGAMPLSRFNLPVPGSARAMVRPFPQHRLETSYRGSNSSFGCLEQWLNGQMLGRTCENGRLASRACAPRLLRWRV